MLRRSEKRFYAKRTLVVLLYSQFWQHHGINPDVRHAMTLPESELTRYSEHINYIRGGGEVQNRIGDGNGAFVRPWSVLLFRFSELDFFSFSRQISKKMEGKDPLDPLVVELLLRFTAAEPP
jgi:hypothetical protein